MKTPAPEIIHKLVETFEKNLEEYRSTKNETELRRQFLDPFFEALGWDVNNIKGASESEKEVAHEFSVEIEHQQKKADYAFRASRENRNKFDFLVEAKKPSVKIENSQDSAFQVRRYGWSAKLPINILTDFEHFAVYDCRAKPSYNDKASFGRITLIHYKEYAERWDEIASIFSPEAVRKGSLTKYVESIKGKKGTADVDDAFLQEIERWRELLAKNIALRNEEIDITGLNYSVQMTIDRIVFLRICEERDIEPENQLQDIANKDGVYEELCALFKRADTKYNSGLFHFTKEKDLISRPDDLTLTLNLDDKVLKDIILNLYYPKSPYAFLYIPADILGQVYERFLGKVIRLTAGHQAKVEEKPEVRKAGGVYYTPTYIVDYIVKNTVGNLVENKTPKEVAALKIVDPACGSGTFLLGAYQFLLDWHLNWYISNEPEKWTGGKSPAIYQPINYYKQTEVKENAEGKRVIREGVVDVKGEWKLTTAKKKEILLNNIYGVDVDGQAVEVTKLSLLLKLLENANGQLGLGMERILPDLGNNIQHGNSLIGTDYFEGQLLFDGDAFVRINPLDWRDRFKDVFATAGSGGFDVVIGNPPYIKLHNMEKSHLEYYFRYYKTAEKKCDVYSFFIERDLTLLLRDEGALGYITSDTWLNLDSFTNLRKIIAEDNRVLKIVTLENPFSHVSVSPVIFFVSKQKRQKYDFRVEHFDIHSQKIISSKEISSESLAPPNYVFDLSLTQDSRKLLKRIENKSITLESAGVLQYGIMTADNDKFVLEKSKNSYHKPLLSGEDLRRYEIIWAGNRFIDYRPDEMKRKATARPGEPERFEQPEKIVFQRYSSTRIIASLDASKFYTLGTTIIFRSTSKYSNKYLLGLVNSKLLSWWYGRSYTSPTNYIREFEQLPICEIDFSNPVEKTLHDKMDSLVERMLALQKSLATTANNPQGKEMLERQIESTDKAIDSLVYELYGLSEEEIKIVEGK